MSANSFLTSSLQRLIVGDPERQGTEIAPGSALLQVPEQCKEHLLNGVLCILRREMQAHDVAEQSVPQLASSRSRSLLAFAYGGYRRQVHAQASAHDASIPKGVLPATASASEVEKEIPSGNAPLVRGDPNRLQPPDTATQTQSTASAQANASCGFDPRTGQPFRFNPETGQPCMPYQDRVVVRQPAYARTQSVPTPSEPSPEERRIAAAYQRQQEAMIAPTGIRAGSAGSFGFPGGDGSVQSREDLSNIAALTRAINPANSGATRVADLVGGAGRNDSEYDAQNMQTTKAAFMDAAQQQKGNDYLRSTRTAPLSSYEIKGKRLSNPS